MPSQLGKTTSFARLKNIRKNSVILPEYFRFPGYLSSGSQSFERVAKCFVFFFPGKFADKKHRGEVFLA